MTTKILIVEDDPFLAIDLRQEVESLGYEVVGMAESADEALMATEAVRPDLTLMDINIAGTMDGIEVARMLHDSYRVPTMFLTSASDDVTVGRAADLPMYGYLVKPFRRNELKASIQVALKKVAAEEAMATARESAHQKLAATVAGLPEGVLTVSLDHCIEFMNASAEGMTGFQLSECKGKKLFDVLRLIDTRKHRLADLNDAEDAVAMEEFGCSLAKKGHEQMLVDVVVAPLKDDVGQRTGFVVTLRNASERLRLQAVEEILDEVHSFDLAPMPMIQLDGEGMVVRVNAAMLHDSGMEASIMVGRSLTELSMDPDPRIAQTLFNKLLQADTSATNVDAGMMH